MREAPQCDTGFPACKPAQSIVKAASRRLLEDPKRQDAASTVCHSPAVAAALPSNLPRSTSSAPVIRSNVSMVGSRSRFSTRETIVWLSPDRVATSFSENFRRSRSSRSNSTNRPITASRSDAFDTPASYATESLTRDEQNSNLSFMARMTRFQN